MPKTLKKYSIVIAVDEKNGIWKDGKLAWSIKEDMQHFKNITTKTKKKKKRNAVIMGRKTWESIPKKFKPLPDRLNCVLSSDFVENPQDIGKQALWFNSFEACHEYVSQLQDIDYIFIIGWSYLYNLVLESELLDTIYLTKVYGDFNCDVFFSEIPSHFKITKTSKMKSENDIWYQMLQYKNKGVSSSSHMLWILIIGWLILITIAWGFLLYQQGVFQNIKFLSSNDSSEIVFEERVQTENNITTTYPVTWIEDFDIAIQKYIRDQQIKYKIIALEEWNETSDLDITFEYEIVSQTKEKIIIKFTEMVNWEIAWGRDISYYK